MLSDCDAVQMLTLKPVAPELLQWVTQVHATAACSRLLQNQRAAPAARTLACWASSLELLAPFRHLNVSRSWLMWDRWPVGSWSSLMGWPCASIPSSCVPGELLLSMPVWWLLAVCTCVCLFFGCQQFSWVGTLVDALAVEIAVCCILSVATAPTSRKKSSVTAT